MQKFDVKTMILDLVQKMIEEEKKVPWRKPWISVSKRNWVSGKEYRGINRLLLGFCQDSFYLTFNQASKLGFRIKTGAKSKVVVFWKFLDKKKTDQNTEPEAPAKKIPLLRYYRVFGVSDIEGITEELITKRLDKLGIKTNENVKDSEIDSFISKLNADIRFGGDSAFYSPLEDYIQIPELKTFTSTDTYYETIFHELIHWTKHKQRLDRGNDRDLGSTLVARGDEYSYEELVAEIGAVILLGKFGRKVDEENSASYIAGWASFIKGNKNALFGASTKAEDAVSYLLKKGGIVEEKPAEEVDE
jgi:antirestriction protein ArdC